jgi:hypothetical protein
MDAKLTEQVEALLRGAGFTQVLVHKGDEGTTVGATQGETRAVFHIGTGGQDKKALRTTSGGPIATSATIEAAVVDSYPELLRHLLQDEKAAGALGLSPEVLKRIRAPVQ